MNLLITVLALAAVIIATEAGPQGRISFGNIAADRQFPYQVGLSRTPEDNAQVWCSGSIISTNFILTAGHCVYMMPQLTVRFGSSNFSAPSLKHTVDASQMRVHEGFNPSTLDNDIAVIRIPTIEYTDKIYFVTLPSMRGMPPLHGLTVIASGWGANEFGNSNPSHLKYAEMTVMTNKQCEPSFQQTIRMSPKKMCTSNNGGVSICGGDSGGPCVLRQTTLLVGVSSFQGCRYGKPSGFVRVSEYLEWIRSNTGVSY